VAKEKQFRAIKGVRDILPPETALWNWFEQTAREVIETYNFREIRLPIFEQTELFARSIGLNTDVVSKEMYTFEDHDLRWLDLLRSNIAEITKIVSASPPTGLSGLVSSLNSFLASANDQMNKGNLPKTPTNAISLTRLEGHLNFFASVNDSTSQDEIKSVSQDVRDTLDTFELGVVVTLRPEATASVVRAYIEHGMHTWPQPVKLYYVGPMFRRERPQKGRYRQFYQIGAEVLGQSDHAMIDAELIEMLTVLLERCRLDRWTLFVNSIGCKECRPAYVACLRKELEKVKGKLGPDSQRRIETNPLRVLDSKLPEEQAIIEKLPRITDHLCAACREHFAGVQDQLKLRGIPYEVNWRLVRGLDYYMRTTFEITSPVLGAQNALVGGGRYDGLSELLGGAPAKGIGFALGEDRFILAIEQAGKVDAARPVDVFVAWIGGEAYPAAVKLARRLRSESLVVEVPPEDMKLKKSLGLADKLGARYAVLLGEKELASGQFVLRRLSDGEQKTLTEAELLEHLKSERARGAGSAE